MTGASNVIDVISNDGPALLALQELEFIGLARRLKDT